MMVWKIIPLVAGALGMVCASSAKADEPSNGELVKVEAKYVFAPVGFDDNDETQIVIDGYLPSGCYRVTRPEVKVDHAARAISITPMARYFNVPCIEALVPYHDVVKLGVLPEGIYKVNVMDGRLTESMQVNEATNAGPDDYLYAPVDSVSVARDAGTGELKATLAGRFTNSCMAWDEVKVIDNGKTINVLPVIKMAEADDCVSGEFPYAKSVALPATVTPGRHLLHVRSLNGQAVNELFYKSSY